ncbi:hypothetical protein AUP68_10960 [Ilyonectria robusta]
MLPVPRGKILQIPGLTVYKGWRCNICPEVFESSHFTVSADKIRDHIVVHNSGLMPIAAEQLQKFQPCYLQTFSSAKGRIKYFEIEPALDRRQIDKMAQSHAEAREEGIAAYQRGAALEGM